MIKYIRLWLSRQTLSFRLSVSILTCVLVGFVALILFISKRAEPIIESQIEQNATKTIDAYVSDFMRLVSETERLVLNTKNTLNQVHETDISSLRLVLNSVIRTIDDTDLRFINVWVYVFESEDVSKGTLYISEQNEDGGIAFKTETVKNFYDNFPWFKEVPKVEKIYWSEPYIDAATSKAVVTTLVPFMFQGNIDFNGLVALTVDLSDLQNSINNFSFYDAGKLILLSKNGLYVTHPNSSVALKMTIFELARKLRLPELARVGAETRTGQSGSASLPWSSVFKSESIVFYDSIPKLGWGIHLVYPQSEFLRPIREFQAVVLGAFVICMFVLLLIINLVCRLATTQLLNLSKIATRYGLGDFSDSFDKSPSSKEIGVLSNALNNMRTNLLSYIQKEKKEASDRQRTESEMNIARDIQNSALQKVFPTHPSFDVFASMTPARQVSGDFYDLFFLSDDKIAIVIADVAGKGIPAALYMMRGQALIKNVTKSGFGISEAFHLVNKELCQGNDTCMFITAFLAVIDLKTGLMQYINAGHTPLIINQGDGYQYIKTERNVVLGVKPRAVFKAESLVLKPDARVFLYTDGVTEAENKEHRFYGGQRLLKALNAQSGRPQETLEAVLKDIHQFTQDNAQSDDITMLEFVYHKSSFNELTVKADIKNLQQVLTFVKQDMSKYNLSENNTFKVVTASEEIFANVALYAYTQKENTDVVVKTHCDGTFYHVTFSDFGEEYNPLLRMDPDVKALFEKRRIGGLGIFLVKKFADDVTYTRQNNQNILKISVKIG
ncbi:MAG: SpoIIE family protein phosphatase [Alphaproteobacteria bacterium]|nr:SpoIIE family protein phosphatase [Alphaproteobacteria bacterium]